MPKIHKETIIKEVERLTKTLEYVRAYLDDLLCISELSLEDHLEN
jgi:hypothetical protein